MSLSINIFKDMGRRKFRLARHRKNEERNTVPSMLVSVPRDAVTVSVGSMTIQSIRSSTPDLHPADPAVQCQPTEDTGSMLVSFLISVFMQRKISSVDVLLSRLKMISLPSMWAIVGGSPLVV